MSPRPLPPEVRVLSERLHAPPRLVAHLRLVHDTAANLIDQLDEAFPGLIFDRSAVLFGSASHDLGKAMYREELDGPGDQHEQQGSGILAKQGVPAHLARFASTHGRWSDAESTIEDLLVALADAVWKGHRVGDLELRLAADIARQQKVEAWAAWMKLDQICTSIAAVAEERLAWQASAGCREGR